MKKFRSMTLKTRFLCLNLRWNGSYCRLLAVSWKELWPGVRRPGRDPTPARSRIHLASVSLPAKCDVDVHDHRGSFQLKTSPLQLWEWILTACCSEVSTAAMDWMAVSSQMLSWKLSTMWWREGLWPLGSDKVMSTEPSLMGSTPQWEPPRSWLIHPPRWGHSKNTGTWEPGRGLCHTQPTGLWILGFQPQEPWEVNTCHSSHPLCSMFAMEPRWLRELLHYLAISVSSLSR